MLALFLGAGFSYTAGVPLAGGLFDEEPEVDLLVRKKLVDRVLTGWRNWRKLYGGTPEQYLSYLESIGGDDMRDATWYVALVISLRMGILQREGEPTITLSEPRDFLAARRLSAPNGKSYVSHHEINRTTGNRDQERFWTSIFFNTHDVGVITTNYDILAERGMRHETRHRARRMGFHYGNGPERLKGRGNSWLPKAGIFAKGNVPLIKLHGSVSWSLDRGHLTKYVDCRPAFRGDACIIAPVHEKSPRPEFLALWNAAAEILSNSHIWVIVGYSFPQYDVAVLNLFKKNSRHNPKVHIFDPNEKVAEIVRELLPNCEVTQHDGLPKAIDNLTTICIRAEEYNWFGRAR